MKYSSIWYFVSGGLVPQQLLANGFWSWNYGRVIIKYKSLLRNNFTTAPHKYKLSLVSNFARNVLVEKYDYPRTQSPEVSCEWIRILYLPCDLIPICSVHFMVCGSHMDHHKCVQLFIRWIYFVCVPLNWTRSRSFGGLKIIYTFRFVWMGTGAS